MTEKELIERLTKALDRACTDLKSLHSYGKLIYAKTGGDYNYAYYMNYQPPMVEDWNSKYGDNEMCWNCDEPKHDYDCDPFDW